MSEKVRNQTLHVPPREVSFNRLHDGDTAVFPHESIKKERSGKELILATKPYARESRLKSWWYTLSTLGLLIATITGIVALPFLPLKIICSVFSSFLMSRMFVIYHDHQHHAILHRSPLANIIMTIFGVYSLAPPSIWKRSHDHHHKHNSKLFSADIGSYPIASKKKFLAMSPAERRQYLAVRHPLNIIFGYFTVFIYGMCYSSFVSNPRKHLDSFFAMLFHVTFSVATIIYLGWLSWLLLIFIPFFLTFALGAYLFYAQHNFPGVTFSDNTDWDYEKAALQSSSYMKMNPFMHWATANIGYHHVHHLNSRIPFYRLPEVMAAIPELQKATTTSLTFKDIISCLKLKVWDPEKNSMIGLDQIK